MGSSSAAAAASSSSSSSSSSSAAAASSSSSSSSSSSAAAATANSDGQAPPPKKKRKGKARASHVWSKHNGDATADAYIQELDEEDTAKAAAEAAAKAAAAETAAKAATKAAADKELAESVWPSYEKVDFEFAKLPSYVFKPVEKIKVVLQHKLGYNPPRGVKKPANAAAWKELFEEELGKEGALVQHRAALQARGARAPVVGR